MATDVLTKKQPATQEVNNPSVEFVANENVIRKDGFSTPFPFLGTAGATAANYDQVWTSPRALEIVQVDICWSVASSSGTIQLEKLTGTQAPGGGTTLLSAAVSTAGTANTVASRQGNQLTSARQFKQGDRLAFIDSGTLTGLVGLHVTIYWKFVGRGDYL